VISTGIGDLWRVYHPVFIQTHSAWPSSVGRCNEYFWWFRTLLGKKWQVLYSSGPCYQYSRHTGFMYASLIGSNRRQRKDWRGSAL